MQYALHMVIPDVFSFGASLAMVYLVFRKDIPHSYDPGNLPSPETAIRHRKLFITSWFILVILLAGYILTETLHLPVSLVEGAAAAVLLLAAWRARVVDPGTVMKEAPWEIVIFSVGGRYFKTGIILSLPTLCITLTGLYIWLSVIH